MSRLLIVSHDIIGERMAGVGIRYSEIAKALAFSWQIDVTLAAPAPSESPAAGLQFITYQRGREAQLAGALRAADAVLCYPGALCNLSPVLPDSLPVIVDGYDLDILEQLAAQTGQPESDIDAWHRNTNEYTLRRGDFFICATQRQRDWWLGCLDAAGRINTANYRADPTFRRMVDLVPYGIPDTPPAPLRPVMRGVWAGVSETDLLALWGGGVWDWFDPFTLIRALVLLQASGLPIKCVFPGARHPAPDAQPSRHFQRFQQAAAEAGVLGKTVLIGDWADYADWAGCLTEATVGVSLHYDHLEAHFSARTRTLSYIWAGLPMALTRGDELADLAARHGVAFLAPPRDAAGVATALLEAISLRARPDRAALFRPLQERFAWASCVAPIARFMRAPTRAADAQQRRQE